MTVELLKKLLACLPNREKKEKPLSILLATAQPEPELVSQLSSVSEGNLKEAFSTRGVLNGLSGTSLVVMGDVIPTEDVSREILDGALCRSQIPVASPPEFQAETEEWLARARLTHQKQLRYLPPRQINFVNWAGGVGKTTLAMAVTRRFTQVTGLPAALLELSLGGSALHARVSPDLPDFYEIATGQASPLTWRGVDLYPMDGRGIRVLLEQEPERVNQAIQEIRKRHTLFVVDAFPGHPLWSQLSVENPGTVNFVVTSPRDDALLQAMRIKSEMGEQARLVLNMARGVADRLENGVSVFLPYREAWAASLDKHLADPLLAQVYPGWRQK